MHHNVTRPYHNTRQNLLDSLQALYGFVRCLWGKEEEFAL
jgi:hypothetical protein